MRRYRILAISAAFFPLMLTVDSWFFRRWLGASYIDWYIANGTLISVTASLFAVVWKNLNDNQGLFAADPRLFLGANLELIGVQGQLIGRQLVLTGERFSSHRPLTAPPAPSDAESVRRATGVPFSELFDGVAALLAALLMVSVLIVWFVAIVPLQYFIVLVAGAPARLAMKLERRQSVSPSSSTNESMNSEAMTTWESNVLLAPVSMTNAIAALIILAIKLARSSGAA